MKINSKYWLFIFIALILTSCLDVKEEVITRKNGSGTYSFTLQMGELKELYHLSRNLGHELDSLEIRNNLIVSDPFLKIRNQLYEMKDQLEAIDGISRYQVVFDTSNLSVGIKYDFENIVALNNALNILQKKKDQYQVSNSFSYSGKSFERFNTISNDVMSEMPDEKDTLSIALLTNMNYSIILHFDRKIKKVDNNEYVILKNGKTVSFSGSMLEILQERKKTGVKVQLK